MLILQIAVLVLVALAGAAVVLTRDVSKQVIGLSFYGLLLTLMFFIFQAPDVALSQLVIGAVALPLLFMLAIAKIERNLEERKRKGQQDTEEQRTGAKEAA